MKHFSLKLAMMVTMLLSFLSASAYDFEVNDLYFNITDATKHEVEVTSKVRYEASYSGNISIPSTVTNGGTTYSVTAIGEHAFLNCIGLTSVTIPSSVTTIGDDAFGWCAGLTSVTIPNSVTSIGERAFEYCSGLIRITIPSSVTFIGKAAFNVCSGLIEINVDIANRSYASIDGVLYNKTLTEIIKYPAGKPGTTFSIPNSVTTIGEFAFVLCEGLTSITIPNSVTSIGEWAFWGCSGLTSVTIPNSVTSIGEYAFEGCKSLTSVTIPNSVTSIGSSAFNFCSGLIEINVDIANRSYASIDGVLYNKTLTEIIRYPAGKPGTTFSIPNSVTAIEDHAFNYCKSLTSVTIPNSVTAIEDNAFQGCSGLTDITIPNSVTAIGSSAFYGCSGLTSMTIPSSVTTIGVQAFFCCWGLTNVTIPNSVTTIGVQAFCGCSGLTSVTIPNSVTAIEDGTFGGCTGLTNVTIPNSVTSIGEFAFDECPIKSVYCHWTEPVRCDDDLFSSSCYEEGTLYVPKGCAGKYRLISPWSKFVTIEESDNLGIDDIMENQPTGGYIVYDLKGVLRLKTADMDDVKRLPAGLYIVNGRKVLIR